MNVACYDTKPADDCPVCGGMYKGKSCEVCGYDGELVRENVGKDAIDEQIMAALKRKDTTQRALMDTVKAQLEVRE